MKKNMDSTKPGGNSQNKLVKECIFSALMQLMECRQYGEITITDITQKAGVSRISYYRNYSSKEDIIKDYIDEMHKQLIKDLQENVPYDAYKYLYKFFEKSRSNMQLILNLVRSNMSYIYLDRSKHFLQIAFDGVLRNRRSAPNTLVRKFEINFLVGGVYEVLIQWFNNGMIETSEQMASVLLILFQ